MKPKYIIGLAVIVLFGIVGLQSLDSSKIEYVNIAAATETARRVQVKGVWNKETAMNYNAEQNIFTFTLTDESGKQLPIVYEGAKPNNFELAESVVVKGKMDNGTFYADEILTKCPSKYEGSAEDLKGT